MINKLINPHSGKKGFVTIRPPGGVSDAEGDSAMQGVPGNRLEQLRSNERFQKAASLTDQTAHILKRERHDDGVRGA